MASQLDTVITFDRAEAQFEACYLPLFQESEQRLGHADTVARSEAWSNFVDALHANEEISDWQVSNWEHPDCCND